jgi:hypothetical protein
MACRIKSHWTICLIGTLYQRESDRAQILQGISCPVSPVIHLHRTRSRAALSRNLACHCRAQVSLLRHQRDFVSPRGVRNEYQRHTVSSIENTRRNLPHAMRLRRAGHKGPQESTARHLHAILNDNTSQQPFEDDHCHRNNQHVAQK